MKNSLNLVPSQEESLPFPIHHQGRHQSHIEIQEIRTLFRSLLNENRDIFPKKAHHWHCTLCKKG